jgi:hypothetical protein
MTETVDINEDLILNYDAEVLDTLLRDHTTQRNIFWATSDYEGLGKGFEYSSPILPELITGKYIKVIRPRTLKARELQSARAREMAEVFTPSWVCNAQNNLIDEAWFGRKDVFNRETKLYDGTPSWETNPDPIIFPEGKTWKDYVRDTRLEMTCGEAPYLVSLYDTTTGEHIPIERRIGLLDRKLRVVSENTEKTGDWLEWAQEAYKSLYAFEWQGDSLLLAREAMIYSFKDYYQHKFGTEPLKKSVKYIAYIISWNVFQMDGLRCVIPNSCEPETEDLFGNKVKQPCKGCKEGTVHGHNGIPVLVRDWRVKDKEKQIITFSSLIKH